MLKFFFNFVANAFCIKHDLKWGKAMCYLYIAHLGKVICFNAEILMWLALGVLSDSKVQSLIPNIARFKVFFK